MGNPHPVEGVAPPTAHGPRPRDRDRNPLRLRLRRPVARPCLPWFLLPRRRRQHVPGQDAPGVGGGLGVAEPLHDRVEPDRLPLHVLDRAGPHRSRDQPSTDRRLPPRSDRRGLRADGGGVAVHRPIHPGPRGAPLRVLLLRDRPRHGLRDPGPRAPCDLRQPDRHARLADARAQRFLFRARAASLRLVGRVRRAWGRPDAEGDRTRQCHPRRARWPGLAGSGLDPPPNADPDGRRHRAGAALAPSPSARLDRRRDRVRHPSPLHPLLVLRVHRQPRGAAMDVPLQKCLAPGVDQPVLRHRAAAPARADGCARGVAAKVARRPLSGRVAGPARRDPVPAQSRG